MGLVVRQKLQERHPVREATLACWRDSSLVCNRLRRMLESRVLDSVEFCLFQILKEIID